HPHGPSFGGALQAHFRRAASRDDRKNHLRLNCGPSALGGPASAGNSHTPRTSSTSSIAARSPAQSPPFCTIGTCCRLGSSYGRRNSIPTRSSRRVRRRRPIIFREFWT